MKWLSGVFLLVLSSLTFGQQEAPEQIVVIGRLPGPAMWKVTNGDNALWIFAMLAPIPKSMVWESTRVESVISKADEYIEPPGTDADVSPLVLLNPFNFVRFVRLGNRLQRNVDGKPLKDLMPPELYQRFEALKARYFPDDKGIEELRPMIAGQNMVKQVQQKNDLASNSDIRKKIERLVERKGGIKQTRTKVEIRLEGGYGTVSDRLETMMSSIPVDKELLCIESQIKRMETDLEEMKSRANSWAQGWVSDFRDAVFRDDAADPCTGLMGMTTESKTVNELMEKSQQQWLQAAEKALNKNKTTFAVLDMNEMFRDNGLLAQLEAKGYEVQRP